MSDPPESAAGGAAGRDRDRRRLAAAVGRLVARHLLKSRARPAEGAGPPAGPAGGPPAPSAADSEAG